MNVQSREQFPDLIKGVAIILVVAGHCIQSGCGIRYSAGNAYWENYLFKFIYGFHMPLFAMVSGYLFYHSINKRNLLRIIYQRVLSIGIPIITWCSIMLVVRYREEAFDGVISFLLYFRIVMGSSLWFLWALLGCSFLIIGIRFFLRDSLIVYIAFLIISPFITDAHYIGAVKFLYPFFLFGYLINKYKVCNVMRVEFWEHKKFMLMMLIVIYTLILFVFHYDTYFYTSGITIFGKEDIYYQLWNDVVRLIAGFAGCLAVIGSMALLMRGGRMCLRAVDTLAMVGQYTMGIYIVNWQTLPILSRITRDMSYGVGLVISETIIVTIVCLVISMILYRVKVVSGLLFGKWN